MYRIIIFVSVLLAGCSSRPNEVVVYSSRAEHLIAPLFASFEQQTGIPVRWVTDKEGPLIQRLKAEGEQTPADLLLTVDAGNLWLAKRQGLLQPISSEFLVTQVPEHLRDPDGYWAGLSVRARTIAYNTDAVDPARLSTYAALADEQWRGRLCLRTSKKVYNQSLVAMMIAQLGEDETAAVVSGWVANLAAPVFSSDTQVLEAIAAGQCDVGIVNTYYFGRLQRDNPALPVALFWPDQGGSGVHVNISGAGVVRFADNPAGAQKLLEWLASDAAQRDFAGLNLEYPVAPGVPLAPEVERWGSFEPNLINVSQAGELQAAAVRLMDRVGYR